MSRTKLTDNFYLDEFERSETSARLGIDNYVLFPRPGNNVMRLCDEVLQPLRNDIGPLHITSGYRSPKLNKKIRGSKRSAHMDGRAADIFAPGKTARELALLIQKHPVMENVDQLILEFDRWVHISIAEPGVTPRRQVLTAKRVKKLLRSKVQYSQGISLRNSLGVRHS